MKSTASVLTALTGLITIVVAPSVGALFYIHTHWGSQGVMVAGALLVGIPLTLLIGVLLITFLLASQRIWAENSEAQSNSARELYRMVNQGMALQKQRERLDARPIAPDGGDRHALPQWAVVQEDAWQQTPGVPQLTDFRVER